MTRLRGNADWGLGIAEFVDIGSGFGTVRGLRVWAFAGKVINKENKREAMNFINFLQMKVFV